MFEEVLRAAIVNKAEQPINITLSRTTDQYNFKQNNRSI